jgi:hypothetical protein
MANPHLQDSTHPSAARSRVSRGEIDNATIDARAVRDLGREVLFAVASLSLVSSFLIVWLYVGRNIVARLTGLSSCMAAIAGGRRHVIVNTEGTDEVSEMGRAVEVFRQNAIERDALLIERAETAHRLEQLVEERTKELNETVGTLKAASEVIASSIQYASRIQRSICRRRPRAGYETKDHPLAPQERPRIRYALSFGISQSGRVLRDLVHLGFNQDRRCAATPPRREGCRRTLGVPQEALQKRKHGAATRDRRRRSREAN